MRSHIAGLALAVLLLPAAGHAQVYLNPTPDPTVSAANEQWQRTGEAIYFQGHFYFPAGPTEFFDNQVMVRAGDHRGVPIYVNSTLPQGDVIYIPVAGRQMKPYERRRRDGIAGTTGGRVPSFPVEPHMSVSRWSADEREPMIASLSTGRAQWDWMPSSDVRAIAPVFSLDQPALAQVPQRRASIIPLGVITAVPRRETTNAGAFVSFDDQRYFAAGRAVVNSAERFIRVGGLNQAGVYRELRGDARTIYVESVPGGLLAPYTRK